MNFSFSDDQVLLRNSVRAALDEQCPSAHVRSMMEDGKGYGDALWGEMAKLGWLGLPFPEEQGGALNEQRGGIAVRNPQPRPGSRTPYFGRRWIDSRETATERSPSID